MSNLTQNDARCACTHQGAETSPALIHVSIDDRTIDVPAGTTVLEAARQLGIYIPTLCTHPDLDVAGVCRVCVVQVDGMKTLQASCSYHIQQPIKVHTHTRQVLQARANIIDLLFSKHCGYWDYENCDRTGNCELQALAKFGAYPLHFGRAAQRYEVDGSSYSIIRDMNKCILCRRCVRTCNDIQGVGCLEVTNRGEQTKITTFMDLPLAEAICINCGQCIDHCPTAALHANDSTDDVRAAIEDPHKHVVIQTAPAPRAAIGESFGLPPGRALTFEMNTALRQCGFDKVFDTNFSADLTIMEEGTELIRRLYQALVQKDTTVAFPQFTSCSPGWVKYLEHFYPEFIPNLSTAKSPQQMFGAVIKTYYAKLTGISPQDIVTVALMPCTAKKFECNRPEMAGSGFQDVDYVLTTREMAKFFKNAGIDLPKMPKSDFDDPFGTATGSGVIFGATGGVMESALRTVLELVTGESVERYFAHADIQPVRGMDGVRKAEVTIPKTGPVPDLLKRLIPSFDWLNGVTLKVAVAHGTGNAHKVLENIKAGGELASFHFIEFMACPGGCLGGGGQPIPTSPAIREARARAIYSEDSAYAVRKSHENPAVLKLYHEFLIDGPCGHHSHELLHTGYTSRGTLIQEQIGAHE
jgi:NADH-quinone oxidoreductase subunit G/[NiFe] hydrogenase diaphorase moiety small subunit